MTVKLINPNVSKTMELNAERLRDALVQMNTWYGKNGPLTSINFANYTYTLQKNAATKEIERTWWVQFKPYGRNNVHRVTIYAFRHQYTIDAKLPEFPPLIPYGTEGANE